MKQMRIGELAKKAGSRASMIRYYEEIGLLPSPNRTDSEQRLYDERDVARLMFIRRCRELGFSLEELTAMSRLAGAGNNRKSCRAILEGRLAKVRQQIAKLNGVQHALEDILRTGDQVTKKECDRLRVLS